MTGLTPDIEAVFEAAYRDLVDRDCDRTDADLALLEKAGLMFSRELTDDDDFFGLDSLEPGELVYEFTPAGRALVKARREAASAPSQKDKSK